MGEKTSRKKIVVFGPGPMFKGGIKDYTISLARSLYLLGADVHIVSWTQQYPAIIPRDFIDRSSRSNILDGTDIKVDYITNYNNPFSWAKTYRFIRNLKPDMVIFQWSIALQGLPMGRIMKKLRRHPEIEVIVDCHLVQQKENSSLDRRFCKMGLRNATTFITHAQKTSNELVALFPQFRFEQNSTGKRSANGTNTIIKLFHPVYDLFKPDPNFDIDKVKAELGLRKHVFLFFGFIRKYKGLHHCIRSFAQLARERDDVSLLIVGESFWKTLDTKKFSTRMKQAMFGIAKKIFTRSKENESEYQPLELIRELGIEDRCVVVNRFVGNDEVPKYFQVSDCVLLYYETATPSGVESVAYNFHMPVLATRVGHFPETVQHGFNGYLAEPENIESMTEQMRAFLAKPIPRENVAATSRDMSWENYSKAILNK